MGYFKATNRQHPTEEILTFHSTDFEYNLNFRNMTFYYLVNQQF